LIRVFGITGTNGKTTASWMLRSILEQSARCGLIGTIEYDIGQKTYIPVNTTPGHQQMLELFEEMKTRDVAQCVMEVSSHGITQNRISGIEFTGLGFTNLSRDHLDYHGSMESYFEAKKKLFTDNPVNSAINIDGAYGKRMYAELTSGFGKEIIRNFSLINHGADIYGRIINKGIDGTLMKVYESGKSLGNIVVKIPGEHFASDALLAVTMALQAGIDFIQIKQGLESVKRIPGRMEIIGDTEDTLGIVDYAHTPDSLEKLLQTVAAMKRGRLLCVFGCGGFRDKGKRQIMGEIAGRCSDYCIITNDNPRGEPPENILQAIEEGVYPTGCSYCIIPDRYQAIKRAVSLADKWDIIVVAGKGHESYQLSGNENVPFNDREVLKELLEKKYEKTYDETD